MKMSKRAKEILDKGGVILFVNQEGGIIDFGHRNEDGSYSVLGMKGIEDAQEMSVDEYCKKYVIEPHVYKKNLSFTNPIGLTYTSDLTGTFDYVCKDK